MTVFDQIKEIDTLIKGDYYGCYLERFYKEASKFIEQDTHNLREYEVKKLLQEKLVELHNTKPTAYEILDLLDSCKIGFK